MLKINLRIISVMGILLAVVSIGLHDQNVFGAVKPFFPSDPKGQDCSNLFDQISDLRAKSDKQGGQLSGEDQNSLDALVSDYNTKCRPHYGGNPRIAGETGILGDRASVLNPGLDPKPPATGQNQPPVTNALTEQAIKTEASKAQAGILRDTIQPKVVSTNPVNGATHVPLSPIITATFSEPVRGSTLNPSTFQVKDTVGNIIPGVVTKEPIGDSPTKIMFKPSSQLTKSTVYSVTITTGVQDLAGNPLLATTKWSFMTTSIQVSTGTFQSPKDTAGVLQPPKDTEGDTAPFIMLNLEPSVGATGVPVTSSIVVTFNKAVQPSTVSTTSFKLTTINIQYEGTPPFTIPSFVLVNIPGTVSLSNDGKSAIFDPAQQLWPQKTYSYALAGVKDLSGNPLTPSPNMAGSFTTG